MNPPDYYTFSNGTESMDWKARNCERCTKGYDDSIPNWRCGLERAVDDSAFNDSIMDAAAAERIGYVREPYGHLAPDCKERELSP